MAQLLTPTLVDLSTDTVCQFSFAYDTRAYAYYIYVDGVALNVLQWTATESEGFYTVTILESVFTEEKEYAITAQAYVLDGSYEDSEISEPIYFSYGDSQEEAEDDEIYTIRSSTLTAIADAIREKTGGAEKIRAVDMATEISSIQGGGRDPRLPVLAAIVTPVIQTAIYDSIQITAKDYDEAVQESAGYSIITISGDYTTYE